MFQYHPLTPDRWNDFVTLFGKNGACGGCWCMAWRRPRKEFDANKGDGNRDAMCELVDSGTTPGILAYLGSEPVGWCAFAPRSDYPTLGRSRVLKPIDDQPVWSITCFFIRKEQRRKGLTVGLLRAVVEHLRSQGGGILEGYPQEPKSNEMPPVFAWTGIANAFRKAGFEEVARRSATRPIFRLEVEL